MGLRGAIPRARSQFGANHTRDDCTPLDNACAASGAYSRGTIMSYSHICGGLNNLDLDFHPFVVNHIREVVDNSCLTILNHAHGNRSVEP
jgi:hypothetical protein